MPNLLLIRHGQASFGAADYDVLSSVGEEQSRRLGQWFGKTGQMPDRIATGHMRRHAQTADLCAHAAGAVADRIVVTGLDEFDHEEVLARHRPDLAAPGALLAEMARAEDPHQAFQQLFSAAVARWIGGECDSDYACSWNLFRERVLASLRELAMQDARTIWAFTSGGPIAVIANALVGAPAEQALAMAWPLVNTSVTRVSLGARRSQLIAYNAWPHLEAVSDAALVTHR
jgi:broad specificity phosphatase PhoE